MLDWHSTKYFKVLGTLYKQNWNIERWPLSNFLLLAVFEISFPLFYYTYLIFFSVGQYDIQYKESKSEVWTYYERIQKPFKPCLNQESQSINEYQARLCSTLNVTDSNISMLKNITYSIVAYNSGSSIPSDTSESVYPIPEQAENSGLTILFIIIGLLALVILIVFAFCIMRKYNSHQL